MEGAPGSTHRTLTGVFSAATATAIDIATGTLRAARHHPRADPEQGPLQVGRQRAFHRQGGGPPGPDHLTAPLALITMRPINLPAYGKVAACPRFRRTSRSAA